jgi:hypothetical protein
MPQQLSGYEAKDAIKNTALREITVTTGSSKVFHNVSVVDEPLNMLLDYSGTSFPYYLGWALPGTGSEIAGWRICKDTYDANGLMTQRMWASGNAYMDKKWSEHNDYPYS